MNVKTYTGKCDTCVFHPGNLMRLKTGRLAELVGDNLNAGAALICHKTLDDDTEDVLCRGFLDAFGDRTRSVQTYLWLGGVIQEVEPPTTGPPPKGAP